MTRNVLILLFASILILSCSEDGVIQKRTRKVDYKPCLFNLSHCFTDQETNLSFPISFKSKLIKKNKIRKITRTFYTKDSIGDFENVREIRIYEFDEEGNIVKQTFRQLYEHADVGELVVLYKNGVDEYGFGEVTLAKNGSEEISEHLEIYDKEEYTEKYLVYSNNENGNYLFFMRNENNWGGVSVDSILHPTPNDVVVFGTPGQPHKIYQVNNKVNEFNVTNVDYKGKLLSVVAMSFDKYPFEYHRTFEYSNGGVCKGFIDSTYSGDQFLMRRISKWEVNELKLPSEISHENQVEAGEEGYKDYERIEYEFFEEDKK